MGTIQIREGIRLRENETDSSIRRIQDMEARLNRLKAFTEMMRQQLENPEEAENEARMLEAYYGSPEWKADFEADEAGLLPKDLPRGVLSEDGIDHALDDWRELRERFSKLSEREDYELKSARYLAAEVLRRVLRPGDIAVDATMGNGHDTLLLCSLVGESGRVYAFDVQREAVEATRRRLKDAGFEGRAVLNCIGHEHLREQVKGPVKAAVFNLGWLPGGDHRITTRTETTLQAVEAALELLIPGGVLVLCAYPGHEEGTRELETLTAWFAALPPREYNVLQQVFPNAGPGAPVCFTIQKQRPAAPREQTAAAGRQ